MNNAYEFYERKLTYGIVKHLIIELFEGQGSVHVSDIRDKVLNYHLTNGGDEGVNIDYAVSSMLQKLVKEGIAEKDGVSRGYWKILRRSDDSIEKDILSVTHQDDNIVEFVENLLSTIKTDIHNLNEDIEALTRQKSNLEQNVSKFIDKWRAISRVND